MSNIYGHQNFVAVPNKEKIEQCLFLLKKNILFNGQIEKKNYLK